MKIKKALLFLLPALMFLLPSAFCLGVEIYNRWYRGLSTPLLMPGIGLFLLGSFFLAKRKRSFIFLFVLALIYGIAYLRKIGESPTDSPIIYYYRTWSLDTQTGRLSLHKPLGIYPPEQGPYTVCHFELHRWLDYFDNQPVLCTALDEKKRVQMFLNDHSTEAGTLREFQLNQFKIARKSLLGEPLDRGALRVAFTPNGGNLWKRYRIKKIYEVYEREIEPGQMRVVESLSRNSSGKLESFTEASLLDLASKEMYAIYGQDGILLKLPRVTSQNFAFPAKVDISRVAEMPLPPRLEGNLSE